MELLIGESPWLALFALSFLAATVIPLGSEWLLIVLLAQGVDPVPLVGVATLGNALGAWTTYAIGLYGGPWLKRNLLRIDDMQEKKAEQFYTHYGCWSLLLAWLPIIGDPLCLVAGVLRVGWRRFLALVTTGKLARYVTVAWLTLQAVG